MAAAIEKQTTQWPLEKGKKKLPLEAAVGGVCACAPVRIVHVPQSHSAPVVSLVFLLSSLIRPPDPQSPSWKKPQRRLIDFPFSLCSVRVRQQQQQHVCQLGGRAKGEKKKRKIKPETNLSRTEDENCRWI